MRTVLEIGTRLPLTEGGDRDRVAPRQFRDRFRTGRDFGAHGWGGARLLMSGDQQGDGAPGEADKMPRAGEAASPAAFPATTGSLTSGSIKPFESSRAKNK